MCISASDRPERSNSTDLILDFRALFFLCLIVTSSFIVHYNWYAYIAKATIKPGVRRSLYATKSTH